jgi:hypothetical protein
MNEGSSPVVNSDGPQELPQDIKLVVQNGNETIQILLKGHVIVRSSGRPQNNGGDAAGQGTATIGQQAAADSADADSLQNMSGWLMAAATLFLGMAYQAATKPPAWMPSAKDAFDVVFFGKQGDPSGSVTKKLAQRALGHLLLNTMAYGISLALVVLLPTMNKATPGLPQLVTYLVVTLAAVVTANMCNAISEDILVGNVVFGVIMVYGLGPVIFIVLYAPILVPRIRSLLACLLAPRRPAAIHSWLLDRQQQVLP